MMPAGTNLEARVVDITSLAVDAIVNAANNSLLGGGGVDGAIPSRRRAETARRMSYAGRVRHGRRENHGRLPPSRTSRDPHGRTRLAGWRRRRGDRCSKRCYEDVDRDSRKKHALERLAFPAISCGVYGYPIDAAAARRGPRVSAIAAGLPQRHEHRVCVLQRRDPRGVPARARARTRERHGAIPEEALRAQRPRDGIRLRRHVDASTDAGVHRAAGARHQWRGVLA